MKHVVDALHSISQAAPAQLPAFHVPPLPNLDVLTPLAKQMGSDPTTTLDMLGEHSRQRNELEAIATEAQPLIENTISKLVGEALNLLTQALPLLPALAIPNPAAQASARATLEGHIARALAAAATHVTALQSDLASLTERSEQIVESPEPTTNSTSSTPAPPPSSGNPAGEAAAQAALSQVGAPYAWGGTSSSGFDCSGLTQFAYRQAGIELPRLAEEQTVGRQVSAEELQPGDLAVWDGHVAMYAGDGMLVEAGDPVQTNPVRTSNMGMAFKGFWRPTG
ncbi:C40 family peptidase [Corynebacterium tapiri]|uniref:Glycoside hydrolase n=1 Tax=Corynebacterium tapiri TaxID=1448266 RepID=A0A5C4U5H7_9CORY|nr:C40 family peptidase [Corynebacterium tapiri]TNL98457.1 glycoside hydrolase [Corynebacterium tapiri]